MFCNWLSAREGIPQPEWVYPPRMEDIKHGTTTSRFFGESASLLGEYAWYSSHPPTRKSDPVAARQCWIPRRADDALIPPAAVPNILKCFHLGLLLITAACRPTDRGGSFRSDSTASSGAGSSRTGVGAICDSVEVLWRATGRATVRVIDTTARIGPYWDERQQAIATIEVHGCATVADAPAGLHSVQYGSLYWKENGSRGWSALRDRDADGPDGNTRTQQRGDIMCQIDQGYDGGDDSDSTYVPSAAFRETTLCWQVAS